MDKSSSYLIKLAPLTVDHAPAVNVAPVAVVLVVKLPAGKATTIALVAPIGLTSAVLLILAFVILILDPST